jgi:hypothetical protein
MFSVRRSGFEGAWLGCQCPRRLAVALLVGAVVPAAGCGDAAAGPGGWSTTVDTLPAGVARVVHEPPATGIVPTWEVEEVVRIGAVDEEGPASFGQVKGLQVDEAGRIHVLDAQAQEVRVFAPDGMHLRTLGRRGEGPGEFAGANGLMRAADGRLWVVDPQLARMTVFDREGRYETSYRWDRMIWGWVWEGDFDARGRVVEPSLAAMEGERHQALRIYDGELRLMDSIPLAPLPAPGAVGPGSFRWEAGEIWGFVPVPFYPRARKVLDPDVAYWVAGDGDPSYRFARWMAGGDTVLVVETRRPPLPLTPAERDSAVASIQDMLQRRGSTSRLDWSQIPDVRPAIANLFLSDEGDLWVQAATVEPDFSTWDVYAPDGAYLGTAVARFRPLEWVRPTVRGDRFWAVVIDELDVEYVVAGRLRPFGEPAAGR